MAENESNVPGRRQAGLRPRAKGNVFLKVGIVLMSLVLVYSIIQPAQEKEQKEKLVRLTRAKVKMLFNLEYRYILNDTTFVDNMDKLMTFAKGVSSDILPDSMFAPVYNAYFRFDEYKPSLQGMPLSEFRSRFLDSIAYNPLTGQAFILELTTKAGRKSFNIKPSNDADEWTTVGGVKEGEITWDEKAELAL